MAWQTGRPGGEGAELPDFGEILRRLRGRGFGKLWLLGLAILALLWGGYVNRLGRYSLP